MKIWIDITNTPHVSVLLPIIRKLENDHELIITARDFSETLPLLRKNGIAPIVIGGYGGKSRVMKFIVNGMRIINTWFRVPSFDISLSLGGNYVAILSMLRRKPSIVFSDNDISYKTPAFKFGKYFIFPSYFESGHLHNKYGIKEDQIFKFEGFKEDIYIADFKPDPDFLSLLPFKEFITIRPENLKASYVPADSRTIVPELFETFKNENILFIPRYPEEREYAEGYSNIFVPEGPLQGLDVVYYTKAMLTGAGTFAREAALLGTPSVSFFPGKVFLTVDIIMQKKGWEFKSRDPKAIREYLKTAEIRASQQERSKGVLKEVMGILEHIISKESN
jgi:predicted glycosyltransferase